MFKIFSITSLLPLSYQKIVSKCNKLRKIEQKRNNFEEDYIERFDKEFNTILSEAIEENMSRPKTHYGNKQVALTNQILEYKANYFLWMHDFSLPYDDLSERTSRTVSKYRVCEVLYEY